MEGFFSIHITYIDSISKGTRVDCYINFMHYVISALYCLLLNHCVLFALLSKLPFNIFSFKTILCRHLWNFILKSDNYILYMYITKLTCCETSLVPGARWTSGLGYYWALLPIFSIQDLMAQRGLLKYYHKHFGPCYPPSV